MRVVHLVVPDTVGDPRHPSGGNVYDEELARGLCAIGQVAREHKVPAGWLPDGRSDLALSRVLDGLSDGSTAVIDGLLGLGAASVLEHHRHRLQLWLLVHLPLGLAGGDAAVERRSLSAVAGVITTSEWARCWLLEHYGPRPVFAARPGVRPVEATSGSAHGGSLLCVGALVPAKGQDVLLQALAGITDLEWSCRLVGPVDRDRAYVARVRAQARELGDRVTITGPLARGFLHGTADLLVLPTRLEMYGMVVTEALARGIPVVASRTGGVPEAMGRATDGSLPGVLVPPGDAAALASNLRRWLEDEAWRGQLRTAARSRRAALEDWRETARRVTCALDSSVLLGSAR